jgi:predicted kinase
MNELIMLTGLPGCGKSTFRAPYNAVLSTDDYIEKHVKELGKTYNDIFSSLIDKAQDELKLDMAWYIDSYEKIIVWDQTNLTPKSRMRKIAQFDSAGGVRYRKIAVFFEPDLTLAIVRNEARRATGRNLSQYLLEDMAQMITPPTKSEGFDYVLHIPLSSQ